LFSTTLNFQVVAFQAMMEVMAQQYPGVFTGYSLTVTESHQRNKADVSGTAKAVVASLRQMGVEGFKDVSGWGRGTGGRARVAPGAGATANARACMFRGLCGGIWASQLAA
jgi:glutamate dehydrogenase/leucine dehydrogenase